MKARSGPVPQIPRSHAFRRREWDVPTRFTRGVFLPQDRQRHVLAPEFAMHQSPVRLGLPAMAPRAAGPAPALANSRASSSASVMSSGNGQASPVASNRRIVSRTVEGAVPTRREISRAFGRLQSDHIALIAHRKPLRRHPGSPSQSRKAGPYRSQKRPRHPGRHHPGMVGEIISEWRTTSSGISIFH